MANMRGRAVSLLFFAMVWVQGQTQDFTCTGNEFALAGQSKTYKTNKAQTVQFVRRTAQAFDIIDQTANRQGTTQECGVIKKNNARGEIVYALKKKGSAQRYCWKGIVGNQFIVLYTQSKPYDWATLPVITCKGLLSLTSQYQMMVATPVPSSFVVDTTQFGLFKGKNKFKMTYQEDTKALQCTSSTQAQSYATIGSNSITFNPCGTTGTATYKKPFGKSLPIATFVPFAKLDFVVTHKGGGFMVMVFSVSGTPNDNKYYLANVFEASFDEKEKPTYLEINMMTTDANAYSPTGYLDLGYVPAALVKDELNIRLHTSECDSSPCKNGGTCVQKWFSFDCLCLPGFDGSETCDGKSTECSKNQVAGSLCSFKGRCQDTTDGYLCKCDPGFTGPKCAQTTKCLPDICKNGGTCYVKDYAYCACTGGWAGPRCDQKPVCATTKPCKNGGVCFDKPGGDYYCECVGTYVGKNCDGDKPAPPAPGVHICTPGATDSLCLNGGICVDYKCGCQGFFVGKFCQDTNRWFIGSIVLIVILVVILVVTLIVCCFFCTKGRTVRDSQPQKPYNPYASPYPAPPSTSGFGPAQDPGVYVQAF